MGNITTHLLNQLKQRKKKEGRKEGKKSDNTKYWQKCRETGFPIPC